MKDSDNRKYPRVEIYNQQRLLNMDAPESVDRQFVVSKNISATGACVRSNKKYAKGDYVVIRLEPQDCIDLQFNKADIMKLGHYVFGSIIWSKPVGDDYFESGVAFLNQTDGNEDTLAVFTRLLNQDAIDILSHRDLL